MKFRLVISHSVMSLHHGDSVHRTSHTTKGIKDWKVFNREKQAKQKLLSDRYTDTLAGESSSTANSTNSFPSFLMSFVNRFLELSSPSMVDLPAQAESDTGTVCHRSGICRDSVQQSV